MTERDCRNPSIFVISAPAFARVNSSGDPGNPWIYWIPACAGMTGNGQNFGFTQALRMTSGMVVLVELRLISYTKHKN
jgi:hypothetical protein